MHDPFEPHGERRQRNGYASGLLADHPPDGPVRYAALDRPCSSPATLGTNPDRPA